MHENQPLICDWEEREYKSWKSTFSIIIIIIIIIIRSQFYTNPRFQNSKFAFTCLLLPLENNDCHHKAW